MKICPNCQQTYEDEGLNFCLNDGGVLEQSGDQAPPTVMLNQVRPTNENFSNDFAQPISPWQSQQPPSPIQPFQQQTPAYIPQSYSSGGDQTLPIISLILGSCSIVFAFVLCCFGGIIGLPLGIAAGVTGFMGMNNVNQNPQKYDGKGLAVGGMITGGIGILISLGWLILIVIGR